jgi:hypothetical protein
MAKDIMKEITRKTIIKSYFEHFIILCAFVLLGGIFYYLIRQFIYLEQPEATLSIFESYVQIYLLMIVFYAIILIIIVFWKIIFFPTGKEKTYNKICKVISIQELGFKNVKKIRFGDYLTFELQGNYENIAFHLNTVSLKDQTFDFVDIFVVFDISEKLIEESHEWNYLYRDFRLQYFNDKNINLFPQKLSKIVPINDLTDEKLLFKHLQLFVSILNETKYRDKKLIEYVVKPLVSFVSPTTTPL